MLSETFTLSNSLPLDLTVNVLQDIQCFNEVNGVAEVEIVNGTPPYSYYWDNGLTTQFGTVLAAGNHYVIVTDQNGCSATESFMITEPAALTATFQTQETSCHNSIDGIGYAQVTGGVPPFNYQWSNGELSNPAEFLGQGVQFVTITDANNCVLVETVLIDGPGPLTIDQIMANAPTCDGLSDGEITVSATGGTNPYYYYWDNNLYGSTITGLASGVYQLTISDSQQCTVVSVAVTVGNAPSVLGVTITGVNPTCYAGEDGFATAIPTGGTASYSYLWNNGDTNDTAFGLNVGTHTVTITDSNGCQTLESIDLMQPDPIVALLGITDNVCSGNENGQINIDTSYGGTGQLMFSLDGEYFVSDTLFTDLDAGNYTVYVSDEEGCIEEFAVLVNEPEPIVLNVDSPVNVDLGDSVAVNIDVNTTDSLIWSWNPPKYLSCIDCPNPVIYPLENITYQIMALDTNGCVALEELVILVLENRHVFIPNAFTPNNDGTNDVFYIFGGQEVATIKLFRIFDRWGELLFEVSNVAPNDPLFGWDGTFKNKELNPAVFTYLAEVEFVDGVLREYSGDVTLIK